MKMLFNSDYLPDRLDLLNDKNSIAYFEFIEYQKKSNKLDFLKKGLKLIFSKN